MSTELAIAHKSRAHSAVGGSSAKRVLHCPGSVNLCEEWPQRDETEAAAEGTHCHEAIDLVMQGKTEKDTDVIGVYFHDRVMTQELFEKTVEPALEQFDKLDKELGGIDFLNEQRVTFPGIEGAFGTVDIVGASKDRTTVLDWKFGAGVAVEATNNAQLLYYAYAAAHTPETAKFFDKNKPIELYIIQPRVHDGEPFTRWMTTMTQLDAFAEKLKKAVIEAASPDPRFALGDWCRWCNGQPGCDIYNNRVAVVRSLPPEVIEGRVAEYMEYADDMITWGNRIKDLAHQLLENGATIPGWKLVGKRPTRRWADEEKTKRYFTRMKLPADERFEKKLISPAKAEKALKPLGISELPKDLVVSESSGTTLAPADDKRPAVLVGSGALKALAERLSAG